MTDDLLSSLDSKKNVCMSQGYKVICPEDLTGK